MSDKSEYGTVSYRDHSGVILDDGRSIKDDCTGMIYESPLFWVYFWDIEEGRKPPNLHFEVPVARPVQIRAMTPPPLVSLFDEGNDEIDENMSLLPPLFPPQPSRQHRRQRSISIRDDDEDDVIFQLDLNENEVTEERNFILETPIDDLLTEMDSQMKALKVISKSPSMDKFPVTLH